MNTIAEMKLVITSEAAMEIFNSLIAFSFTATTLNGDTYELYVEDHEIVRIESFDEAC